MRYGSGYGKLFARENSFSDKNGGARMSYRRESVLSMAGVPTTCGGTVLERTGARSPYRLKKEEL